MTAETSKMKLFVTIVNGFQLLTIVTKSSISDTAAVLDSGLSITITLYFFFNICPMVRSRFRIKVRSSLFVFIYITAIDWYIDNKANIIIA